MQKEFPYYIEPKLKKKLDNLIGLLNKRDAWVLITGAEGSGKTNTAAYIMYYVHCITGRKFTGDRFYFDSDEMFEWIKVNNKGLVNWDEAALGGLSNEWWSRSQRNLIKFGLTGRKKHHFFVLCIPNFKKLTEYLRVDRTNVMVHMRLNKQGLTEGRYIYLTHRGKTNLNLLWRKKHKMLYRKCMSKYGGHGGTIPYVFNKILNEKDYDKKKDEAIANIGKDKFSKESKELREMKAKIGILSKCKVLGVTKTELAKQLGINRRTLLEWSKIEENTPKP